MQSIEIYVREDDRVECYPFKVHWDQNKYEKAEGIEPDLQLEAEFIEKDEAVDFMSDFHDYAEDLEEALSDFLTNGRVECDYVKHELLIWLLNPRGASAIVLNMYLDSGVITRDDISNTIAAMQETATMLQARVADATKMMEEILSE